MRNSLREDLPEFAWFVTAACDFVFCASLERDSTEAAEIFEKLCASFQVIRKASAMPVEKAILPTADSKMSKPR